MDQMDKSAWVSRFTEHMETLWTSAPTGYIRTVADDMFARNPAEDATKAAQAAFDDWSMLPPLDKRRD